VTTIADRAPYHHGDLRNALLATATELASESGPAAVTVRESARRIGVSPSAAYRHFADQADLLAAVATGVLRDLAARMRAAVAAVGDTGVPPLDALTRFRAVGLAYVDYALEAPGLYRTGYAPGAVLPGTADNAAGPRAAEPRAAGTRAAETPDHPYWILAEALDDLVAEGVLAPERRLHAEVAAWAGVHGLAMLVIDGVLGASAADPRPLIDSTLDMIGIGLCAPPGPVPSPC
jgi:AcrR family transcriptional regulator